jgi:hypothetical protein
MIENLPIFQYNDLAIVSILCVVCSILIAFSSEVLNILKIIVVLDQLYLILTQKTEGKKYILKQYLFPTLNQRITVLFLGSMTFHLQVISPTNHFITQSFH